VPRQQMQFISNAIIYARPTIIFGASIGPFNDMPAVQKEMRELLNRCLLIVSRESLTTNYLSDLGIKTKVITAGDPAFLMQPRKPLLTKSQSIFITSDFIGMNFSPIMQRMLGADNASRLVIEIIEKCISAFKYRVLLIPHVHLPPYNSDYFFMKGLMNKLSPSLSDWVDIMPLLPAPEIKWVISKARMFIGARTHSTIAAFSSFIPTLTLSYSRKAKGINLDLFGDSKWMISMHELEINSFLDIMKQMNENRYVIADSLRYAIDRQTLSANNSFTELKSLF
jgi:colanic acid/amylovoran biosynthesis protein